MSPLLFPIQYSHPHPHPHPHPHQYYLNTAPRPIRPTQHQFSHPHDIRYRLASSGRGFIPKPIHAATVAAHPSTAAAASSPRPLISYPQPHGFSHPVHVMRPPHHHHLHPAQLGGLGLRPGPGPGPGPVKDIPVSSPQPEVTMVPHTVAGKKRCRAEEAVASPSCTKPRIEDSDATASESGSTPIEVSPTISPITSPTGHQQVPPARKFDSSKFIDADASDRYYNSFVSRSVLIEQQVVFADFEKVYPRVKQIFDHQGWTDMLSSAISVSSTLVREFYANMHDFNDGAFKSRLRGKTFTVSPDLIRELIGTPLVHESPYPWPTERLPSRCDIIRCFADDNPTVMNEVGVVFGLFDFPGDYRLIYRIVMRNLHLIANWNPITDPVAYFLYALLEHHPIDFGSHAINVIWNLSQADKNATLPFGGLIMRIAKRFGIDPDVGDDIRKPSKPFDKNFIRINGDHLLSRAVPSPNKPKQPVEHVQPTLSTHDLLKVVAQLVREVSQLREVVAKQETAISRLQETLDDHITAFGEEQGMLVDDRHIQDARKR